LALVTIEHESDATSSFLLESLPHVLEEPWT
jgi:hypothetical protein